MLLGLRRVDGADAGVMVGAAHHLQMEHARECAVGKIGCLASNMARRVGPLQANAELFQVIVALVGKVFLGEAKHGAPQAALCELARAAASTALMIGS